MFRYILAVVSTLAIIGTIYVDMAFSPPNTDYCTNRFIDRPDCPNARRACGLAIGREYCPERPLSYKERQNLLTLPIEKRPPSNMHWGVPEY